MPKVELNLEDDELKELLLGDRDKAMQSIMAKILGLCPYNWCKF
ncbi:hypothetical protein [Limosilactobacillus fermentum]|nr:hypothetical protein [Limosilactobacillus fermentum]WFA01397.1 hypothetical protein P3T70_07240 [Limosilactobacillus fermentum]